MLVFSRFSVRIFVMDFHDKDFLNRLMALTEENNAMLHKIRRATRLALFGRILYWFVVIGLSIGAFYYLQPYIDRILSVYTGFNNNVNSFQGFMSSFGKQ